MKYLEKEHNWDIHVKNNYGDDAYLCASCYGCLKIMKYLEKEHNWDIHVKNINGYDAYLLASLHRHLEIIKYLNKIKIEKGMKYVRKISNNLCNICLDEFNKNDKITRCTNGHTFCFDCYCNLDNKTKCCICNQDNIMKEYIFTYK